MAELFDDLQEWDRVAWNIESSTTILCLAEINNILKPNGK
jgi:hypothetical protein